MADNELFGNSEQLETHDKRTETHACDLISRQAAIDALGERPMLWINNDEYTLGARNQYDMDRLALETVPSAQQWTPVTKRLPKAYEPVNVTVQIPEGRYVQESALMDTGWEGISAPAEVIAWCPLLAPWEGEQDGERKDGETHES